jgi:hypothetical protein
MVAVVATPDWKVGQETPGYHLPQQKEKEPVPPYGTIRSIQGHRTPIDLPIASKKMDKGKQKTGPCQTVFGRTNSKSEGGQPFETK